MFDFDLKYALFGRITLFISLTFMQKTFHYTEQYVMIENTSIRNSVFDFLKAITS